MAKSSTRSTAPLLPLVTPDRALAAVVGAKPMARLELARKLWAYITRHGLEDRASRSRINADAKLRAVFNGRKQVSMFELSGLLAGHVH